MAITTEHALIPFETSPLPEGPWLVLAPHPDDETFGLGGSLLLAKEKDIPVTVVFVTLGERAGDPAKRREEALRAAEALGVREVKFLKIPDRKVYEHRYFLMQKCKKLFKEKYKTIFLPSLFEFHPDHRATTLAALAVVPFWKEVWLYEIARQGEINRLIDISQKFSAKERVMRLYASQIVQNRYLEIVKALNIARTYTLEGVTYAEGFFAARGGLILRRYARWLKKYFSF